MRLVLLAAVLLLHAAAATLSSGGLNSGTGLNVTYRLPLGITPNTNGVIPVASDSSNYYTLDSYGGVRAFRGSDGVQLWSVTVVDPLNLLSVVLFDGAPDYVFLYGTYNATALTKSTGDVAARFGEGVVLFSAPKNEGIVVQYGQGNISALTSKLKLKSHIPCGDGFFSNVAVNPHYVAALWQANSAPSNVHTVVYSAKTGDLMCNISHAFDTQGFLGIPFVMIGEDLIISGLTGHNDTYKPVVYNLSTCRFFTTEYVGDVMGLDTYSVSILRPSTGYMYAANYSVTGGLVSSGDPSVDGLSITKNRVGTNTNAWSIQLPSGGYQWQMTQLLFGTLPFHSDAFVLQWNNVMGAFNTTTGEQLWNVSQQLAVAPANAAGQYVFPLGRGRLLVPNVLGYVIYDVHSQTVEDQVVLQPITGVASFISGDGSPMVAFIDRSSGSLVGGRV